MRSYAWGATLFTLAICGMHFTGMAAVVYTPDPLISMPNAVLDPGSLAIAVAAVAVAEEDVAPGLRVRHDPAGEPHAVRRAEPDFLEGHAEGGRGPLGDGMQGVQRGGPGDEHGEQAEKREPEPQAVS